MFNLILIVLDVLIFLLFWWIRINTQSNANFLDKQPSYFGRICKQLFIRWQIRQICVIFVYHWYITNYSFQSRFCNFIFTFSKLKALLLPCNIHAFVALCHVKWPAKSYILHLKCLVIALKFHFSCFTIACLLPLCIVNFSRMKVLKCCFRGIIWLKISTFFQVVASFITFRYAVVLQIITHLPIY